jgi:hypothetical protein
MDSRTDEGLFIIYTNADVEQKLKSNTVDFSQAEFLMTGGSVLQFNLRGTQSHLRALAASAQTP